VVKTAIRDRREAIPRARFIRFQFSKKYSTPFRRTAAIRNEGANTLAAITSAFNERKVPTPREAQWHVSTVATSSRPRAEARKFRWTIGSFIDGSSAGNHAALKKKAAGAGGLRVACKGVKLHRDSRTRRPPPF